MGARKEEGMERVLRCIEECKAEGYVPTIYEIADKTSIPKTTVSRYLSLLRAEGRIERAGRRNIVTAQERREREGSVRVPLLGSVSCGLPKFAEENIEEYVSLPASLFGRGEFFLLRAVGESMIKLGIEDGDLVLVRRQDSAEAGQVVVALTEDEATLKRYYPEPERGRIRLQPENDAMEPIYVSSCLVQGIAVKVIKDLR